MSGGEELDPRRARTSAELVGMLRTLKSAAGLSYREIEQRARDAGDWLPASTLATVFGRTTVPRAEVVAALVQACGGDPDTVSRWVDASRRLSGEYAPEEPAAPAAPAPVVPRQLPGDLPSFVGRTKILDRLDSLLDPDGPYAIGAPGAASNEAGAPLPIVALVGPGGIGKTALAVRWAHAVSARFADGQLFADLKGFSDTSPVAPSPVLHRFLRALGATAEDIPADLDERLALYRSLLAGRRVVVVLDNARDAAQIRPLLPGSAGCLVVVTSRVELRGLAVSHDLHAVPVDALSLDDGMQLLVRLLGAQRVRAEANAAVELVKLCHLLPLALRLAAAQLAVDERQSIARFVRRVMDAGQLSTLTVPDDPDTALRTTFDLSYAALGPEAQRLLRLSGSHPGPDMSLASLAALTDRDVRDTRRHMDELSTLHLVRRSAEDRWDFHDLVREYITEHLAPTDTGERKRHLRRLLDWHVGVTTEAIRYIAPGALREPAIGIKAPPFESYTAALAWLDEEHLGIIAGIIAAERAGLSSYVFTLVGLVWRYFMVRGQFEHWAATQELAHRMAQDLGDADEQIRFSLGLGNAYGCLNDPERSLECFERALSLSRRFEDRQAETHALCCLCTAYSGSGRYAEAREYLVQARKLLEGTDDLDTLAGTCMDMASIEYHEGRYDEAIAELEHGLELFTELGERTGIAVAQVYMGRNLIEKGELVAATLRLEQGIEASQAAGFVHGETAAHSHLSVAGALSGADDKAQLHHGEAVRMARKLGDASMLSIVFNDAGRMYMALGDVEEAARFYRSALTYAERSKHVAAIRKARAGVENAERALKSGARTAGRIGAG